jgi:Cupin superfamily protein
MHATQDNARPFRAWAADPTSFSTHRVSEIRHNFHEHPLMALPSLARLARSLAQTQQCRFIHPGMAESSAFHHEPNSPDGRSVDEVFRRIEERGSWVALYNVQTDPEYDGFLQEVIASVRDLVDSEQPGIFKVAGFIFISAPPSITPFHIDRENNFWLQIHGRKTMHVWNHDDREIVSEKQAEDFIVYGAQPVMQEHLRSRCHKFETKPGDGVYFPVTSPHMTRTDTESADPRDAVSISIGVVFYTEHTRRTARIQAFNQVLRRLGVVPSRIGKSAIMDSLKATAGRVIVDVKARFRGYKPPPSF